MQHGRLAQLVAGGDDERLTVTFPDGAPVSVVLQREIVEVAQWSRRPELVEEPARFRANVIVDGELSVGDRFTLGTAQFEAVCQIDRCAVMDQHPDSGVRDARVLQALAGHRRTDDGIMLGLGCRVVRPGEVSVPVSAR